MAEPFIGEIRIFAGTFAPNGWSFCDGSLKSIADYDTLFTLIGTTYGGDGVNSFGLPNLLSRVPIHMGTGPDGTHYVLGQSAGSETVTLNASQIPAHSHAVAASSAGGSDKPAGNVFGAASTLNTYSTEQTDSNMNAGSTSITGGSQPHDNMIPFQTVNYIISYFGIYPTQS